MTAQVSSGMGRWIPAVRTVRSYRRPWLRRDVVAGIVLTAVLIPAGMGYAEAAGLPFEVPVFVLALVRLRILTAAKLRSTWRIGVFAMTVVGVLLPGVDPVSTILSVIPLVVLYLLSIGLATFLEPRWRSDTGTAPLPE